MALGLGLWVCAVCPARAQTTAPAASGSDWPHWRGPNHDGVYRGGDWDPNWPGAGPKRLWTRRVGLGFSSMSVAGGRLYTMGWRDGKDTVWCLDANTGKELWRHSYAAGRWNIEHQGGTASTPTVHDGKVYSLSRDGHLFCLRAGSGKVVWSRHIRKEFKVPPRPSVPQRDYGYSGSPLVRGKLLIVEVGGVKASTVAFNKDTGKTVWAVGSEGAGYGSPAPVTVRGTEYVAVLNLFGLVVLRVSDGGVRLRVKWATPYGNNCATPVVVGQKVFISSSYEMGCALIDLSGDRAKVAWRNRNMHSRLATAVYWKGYLYGFDYAVLTCLHFDTGVTQWRDKRYGFGHLIVADGKLIVQTETGILAVGDPSPRGFRPTSLAKALTTRPCWTVPVLARGRIYCRSGAGELVCLDVRKK